ncbi:hypothetical protein ACE1CI_03355 [Aerosakkonemataceae cyanobacterium BLCC-F50]|uniref:Uncharacterized protein n=1 Tax=Floridaenema flaviceps BLCC-F50 TaxID=3153642 RepID=A0ABV4XLU7_9CYAN
MLIECRDLVALLNCYLDIKSTPITLDLNHLPLLQEIYNRASDFSSDEHRINRIHFGAMPANRIQQITSHAIETIVKHGSALLID